MGNAQEELVKVDTERGRILSNFAYIEFLITKIILSHYIKNNDQLLKTLNADIFESDNFSFSLKFNLFKKVIGKYYVEEAAKIKYKSDRLNQLMRLRNQIAHARVEPTNAIDNGDGTYLYKDIVLVHGGERYIALEKIAEYNSLKDVVQPELQNLATHLKMFTNEQIKPDQVSKTQ